MLKTFFKKIIEIGIVVNDIEKTLENFCFKYGIGPWSIFDCSSKNIKNMFHRGKPVNSRFKLAECRLGEITFEIIQPLDDNNIFSVFLKNKGQYLHHIGYEVMDYDKAVNLFRTEGYIETQSGSFYGKRRFIFFESEIGLKHTVKFIESDMSYFKYHQNNNQIGNLIIPEPSKIYPEKKESDKMQKPVFSKIAQVSFIVKNVDEMVRKYNYTLGIGPWKIWEFGPDTVNDMAIHGKRSDYRMRLALAKIGDIDIELIQPRDDKSIYADFLKTNGEGFHHLAYIVEDFDKLMQYMEKIGIKVSMSGNWCGKHIWVYLTTENDIKHIVELNSTEPGFIYPEPVECYPPK
jgi:catechol 2,3-dioxygenase-like lactoylglutathione lyase family enzyme